MLLERAQAFEAELIELRRDLHRHPELSFREVRTARVAAERVAAAGYRVRTEVGRTGVVAELENGTGPVVALRADMDALPITEANEVDYASTVPGVMHACGHDAHVSILVGAARLLADARERGELPAGTVRLIFQPSEEASDAENKSGAQRMIEDGAMDGVSAVFGAHVGAHLPAGRVYLREGPFLGGSDSFRLVVRGKSSHAARPDEGVDAIVLAAHAVLACQNGVARRISPRDQGVLTIGRLAGGVAENVIAEEVTLAGTVRYFHESVRQTLHETLTNALDVVRALGGQTSMDLRPGYPPVVNDPAMTSVAWDGIAQALGADVIVQAEPVLLAEDFAFLARQAPGAFLWIGAALDPPREHHHPRFDIQESALSLGASALAACALEALRQIH